MSKPQAAPRQGTTKHAAAPKKAMVLAAGLGTRMRPITDTVPKPMVKIQGRTLIDRVIDRLEEAGVETIVVNLHHLGHLIEEHLSRRKGLDIRFSHEDQRLETGGGVKKALPLLGDEAFFVANADLLLLNGPHLALPRLSEQWNAEEMDALLLLHSTVEAFGYDGVGDFCADADGRLTRRPEAEISPWLFSGIQILHPSLFEDTPDGAFSLNLLYDRAIETERLYGVVHDGEWFHVGTAEGLGAAEDYMSKRYAGRDHR